MQDHHDMNKYQGLLLDQTNQGHRIEKLKYIMNFIKLWTLSPDSSCLKLLEELTSQALWPVCQIAIPWLLQVSDVCVSDRGC